MAMGTVQLQNISKTHRPTHPSLHQELSVPTDTSETRRREIPVADFNLAIENPYVPLIITNPRTLLPNQNQKTWG